MDENKQSFSVNKLKVIVEEVINKAVAPIKKDIEGIKIDLSSVKQDLAEVKEDVAGVKQDLAEVKDTQEDHTRRLVALSGDMEQVLSEIKATHDEVGLWHQRDKREIDEIKRHLDLPLIPDIPQS